MKETENLKLNIYEGTDTVKRIDFNADNEKIDAGYEELNKEIAKKVTKEEGKGLSANNYTDEDKTLVKTIKDKAEKIHTHPANDITETTTKKFVTSTEKSEIAKVKDKADTTYVDSRDNEIIGSLKFVEGKVDENRASISAKSNTNTVTTEHNRQVNASFHSNASGEESQVNASSGSSASGDSSQVNACTSSTARSLRSQVNSSASSLASFEGSQVNSSRATEPRKKYTVVGGYGSGTTPSPNNITWELDSRKGEIYAKNDFKLGDRSVKEEIEELQSDVETLSDALNEILEII